MGISDGRGCCSGFSGRPLLAYGMSPRHRLSKLENGPQKEPQKPWVPKTMPATGLVGRVALTSNLGCRIPAWTNHLLLPATSRIVLEPKGQLIMHVIHDEHLASCALPRICFSLTSCLLIDISSWVIHPHRWVTCTSIYPLDYRPLGKPWAQR